jgi:homocysteine S-methyltransferase
MTRKNLFLERLEQDILLCDGAMGTMLYAKGIYINRCFDELNLSMPELVREIHREYVACGVDILETNTFGANQFKLHIHGYGDKVREINIRAARIAREAAGKDLFVAGAIGPVGKPVEPLGKITQMEAREAFKEQAEALLEGGVDLFILETFSGLHEIHRAFEAIRELCDLPIVAQMTFGDDGNTLLGEHPSKVVKSLEELGVDVVGANCSIGPQVMLETITEMAKVSPIKLSAQPNAGIPQLVDGRFIYLCSPEYMSTYAKRFIRTGVKILGGCCGTTPSHLKAIGTAVKALKPQKERVRIQVPEPSKKVVTPIDVAKKSQLAKKLSEGTFVVSVEVSPPKGIDTSKILQWAQIFKENGIDAINVPDGARASARMSPMALTYLVESKIGIESIIHYCCRDRNLLGIQSDLLGAYALGLRNILAITGDPPKLGDYPNATAVFDVDAIGLVRIINHLNHGEDLAGNALGAPTSFHVGVGANPGAINIDEEIYRFERKVENGAEYVLTQPVYDVRLLENFLKRITPVRIPILVGILPLRSYKNAEFLHNEIPGMQIPDAIRERMRHAPAGEAAAEEGIRIAQEALKEAKDMVQGVYVMPPLGKYDAALRVIEVLK